jgi:hypothetical protein
MKKNFTSTLIMLGLLVGLSAWYVFYEQQYRPKQKEVGDADKKLISLASDQITEIKVEKLKNPPAEGASTPTPPAEYEVVEIKKTGKDWLIVTPVQTKGDSVIINSLVSAACDAKQERIVEDNAKDLTAYGLQNPLLKISFKKEANSPTQELWLGNNTPVAYSLYAKNSGSNKIFKTSRSLKSSLDKDLFALRDKNVLSLNRSDIAEVEIENPKENLVLTKDSSSTKDNWILSRENMPADSLEWNKTLMSLVDLKATKIASEKSAQLADFGLNRPLAKVVFTLTDKKRQTLLVGKSKGSLFAQREGLETIFEIDKTIEEKLNVPSLQYRDKHLAKFDRYSISKIKLETSKESWEVKKSEGDKWNFSDDQKSVLDNSQIDSLLTKLQDIQINKFSARPSNADISNSLLKISLFEKNNNLDKEVVQVNLSKKVGNQIQGTRTGLPATFEISTDDFDKLNISKQSLLKRDEKNNEANKLQKKS